MAQINDQLREKHLDQSIVYSVQCPQANHLPGLYWVAPLTKSLGEYVTGRYATMYKVWLCTGQFMIENLNISCVN